MKCKENCYLLNKTAVESLLEVREKINELIEPENKKLTISKDHKLMVALVIIDNKIHELNKT